MLVYPLSPDSLLKFGFKIGFSTVNPLALLRGPPCEAFAHDICSVHGGAMKQTEQALTQLTDALARLEKRLDSRAGALEADWQAQSDDNAQLRSTISNLKRDVQALEHKNRKALLAIERAEAAITELIGEVQGRG